MRFAQAFKAMAEKLATAQTATVPEATSADSAKRQKRSGWFAGTGIFPAPRLAWQWGFAVAAIVFLVAGTWLMFENVRLRQQVVQMQTTPDGQGPHEQELQTELDLQRQAAANTQEELARVREERERLADQLKQTQVRESQVAPGQQRAPEQQRPSSQRGVSIASFILTPQMRGVAQIPTFSIPADTEQVSMQLQLEPNDHTTFRAALLNQSNNQTLWRSGRLKAIRSGDSKTLRVDFGSGLLRPQVYVLRVMGVSASGATEVLGDYAFRVMK